MQPTHNPIRPIVGICTPRLTRRFLGLYDATTCRPVRELRTSCSRSVVACWPIGSSLGDNPCRYQCGQSSTHLSTHSRAPTLRNQGSCRATRRRYGCHDRRSSCIQGSARCSSAISYGSISDTAASLTRRQPCAESASSQWRVSPRGDRKMCSFPCASLRLERFFARHRSMRRATGLLRPCCCPPAPAPSTRRTIRLLD